jgi:hypothetical protein
MVNMNALDGIHTINIGSGGGFGSGIYLLNVDALSTSNRPLIIFFAAHSLSPSPPSPI